MYSSLLLLDLKNQTLLSFDLTQQEFTVIAENIGACPDGITLAQRSVFWTYMGQPVIDSTSDDGADFSIPNGGINGMREWDNTVVQTAGISTIRPEGSITTGKQLAFDGLNTLYWSDREGGKISTCSLDGSNPKDVIVRKNPEDPTNQCVGVAVDAQQEYFYWTQKGPSKGGVGRIFRAKTNYHGDVTQRTDIETLWENLPEPIDLELYDGFIYWTDRGAAPYGNTLNRAPIPAAGAKPQEIQIVAGGFNETIGLTIDSDAQKVYVTDLYGGLYSVDIAQMQPYGSEADQGCSQTAGLWGADKIIDANTLITGLCGVEKGRL